MKRDTLAAHNQFAIIKLCHSALNSRTLRRELLKHLRTVMPFDYAYFSTTDPATQLNTSSVLVEEPPEWCMSVFLQNEYLQLDFNKFSDMVRQHQSVGILSEATGYDLPRSQRFKDMLLPMAMGDELRAVFVTDAACWGTLCLHREKAKTGYTAAEAAYLALLTPHIADGLRKALLFDKTDSASTADEPGVLILTDNLSVVAATAAAEFWLGELVEMENAKGNMLPVAVRSVIAGLKAIEDGQAGIYSIPKVRVHMRSGHWLIVYASRLRGSGSQEQISVVFEVAQPAEIAPLMMEAYALTKREGEVTKCILRGWSTTEIAAALHISSNTVQDHLKAIFEKVDVSSRGELAARIFMQQHSSGLLANAPVSRDA